MLIDIVDYFLNNINNENIFNKHDITKHNRAISAYDEDIFINNITNYINNEWFIYKPNNDRHWFDFALINKFDDNIFIPIDIKSTTLKTADNTSGAPSLIWSFSNYSMKYSNSYNTDILLKGITIEQPTDNRDYWFIVIHKTVNKILTKSDIIINSIRGLDTITANPSNLPYQIPWEKNITWNEKEFNESLNIILSTITKATSKMTKTDKYRIGFNIEYKYN